MSTIQNINSLKELIFEELHNTLSKIKGQKTKEILSKRKKTFIKEYLQMNNISISSTCSVKTEDIYKTGHLTLKNSKLIICQYLSDKTPQNICINSSQSQLVDIFNPIFFIDFNMVTCELYIHNKKKKFRLIILGKNTDMNDYNNSNNYIDKYRIVKFKMNSESNEVFNLVCENINKSIILSYGNRTNLFGINLRSNFCHEYFINYKKFEKEGNTGDIILFKGYETESKVQRILTTADYDHVGVLVRNKDGLFLCESTGKEGVKSRPWGEFITYYWYLLYDIIAYRKLNVDYNAMKLYVSKNENNNAINNYKNLEEKFYFYFNKKFEEFITKTEDTKYHFSKIGFFCKTKMKKDLFRKTFSCSELIGACYYYARIVTDEYEAGNYLPGHFSKKGRIPFINGFSLGEEYIIDFSSSSF